MGKKDKYIGNEILNNNDKNVEQQINRRDSWEESHTLGKTKTKVTLILAQQFFLKKLIYWKGLTLYLWSLKALAWSNTGSPRFTDFPSNLANLIGWEYETNNSAHTQKIGSGLSGQSYPCHRPEGSWALGTRMRHVKQQRGKPKLKVNWICE